MKRRRLQESNTHLCLCDLPNVLLLSIFEFVTTPDVSAIDLLNHKFHELSRNPDVWSQRFKKHNFLSWKIFAQQGEQYSARLSRVSCITVPFYIKEQSLQYFQNLIDIDFDHNIYPINRFAASVTTLRGYVLQGTIENVFATYLPTLTNLCLSSDNKKFQDSDIVRISIACPNLKILMFEGFCDFGNLSLFILNTLPNLTNFSCGGAICMFDYTTLVQPLWKRLSIISLSGREIPRESKVLFSNLNLATFPCLTSLQLYGYNYDVETFSVIPKTNVCLLKKIYLRDGFESDWNNHAFVNQNLSQKGFLMLLERFAHLHTIKLDRPILGTDSIDFKNRPLTLYIRASHISFSEYKNITSEMFIAKQIKLTYEEGETHPIFCIKINKD